MGRKKKPTLMDSVFEIKRLELQSDLQSAYAEMAKTYGEQFDNVMYNFCDEIVTLQKKCKTGTSFLVAGLLLLLPPSEDEREEGMIEGSEDHIFYCNTVRSAIAWGLEKGYNDKIYNQEKDEED